MVVIVGIYGSAWDPYRRQATAFGSTYPIHLDAGSDGRIPNVFGGSAPTVAVGPAYSGRLWVMWWSEKGMAGAEVDERALPFPRSLTA